MKGKGRETEANVNVEERRLGGENLELTMMKRQLAEVNAMVPNLTSKSINDQRREGHMADQDNLGAHPRLSLQAEKDVEVGRDGRDAKT